MKFNFALILLKYKKYFGTALIFLLLLTPVTALASQRLVEITYDQALNRNIFWQNYTLIHLNEEIRAVNQEIEEHRETYWFTWVEDRERAKDGQFTYMELTARRDALLMERERYRFSTELTLINILANQAGFALDEALMESRTALNERLLFEAQMRYQHGLASQQDIRDAELALQQNHLEAEMLRLSMENEYEQLLRLLRRPSHANIQLLYEIPELEPLPEGAEALEAFVQDLTNQDHTYRRLQAQAEMRRFEWDRFVDYHEQETDQWSDFWDDLEDDDPLYIQYIFLRLQYNLAVMDRNEARRQAELSIRDLLARWERLQGQIQTTQTALEGAVMDYENMRLRYEAGFVTETTLQALRLAVMAQESQLLRQEYALWIARFRLAHPYARP